MQYRVEELAAACAIKVDTVRFYQGRRLIPAPERLGRSAIYGPPHLRRIRQIRSLLKQGFSLAQIQKLPAPDEDSDDASILGDDPGETERALLDALAQERAGERSLSRAELAAEAGIPEDLIAAAETAGLLESVREDGKDRFSSADLEMLSSGLAVLGAGLPLSEFLDLAATHDQHIRKLSEAGIDLFDDHVRKVAKDGDDPEVVARAFREILPQLTRLVALHFQRTLVNRALERLRAKGEGPALERALVAVRQSREETRWQR
jgi:DNA-binding transcriptional MerR regulator